MIILNNNKNITDDECCSKLPASAAKTANAREVMNVEL